jgi:transcriptional regulator with XRE-family HTH domain
MTQQALAQEVEMKQSRISAMERPGTRFNIETLVRLASAFKVGLVVKFVSFSEMLKWENGYSQDTFNPLIIDKDVEFRRHKAPAEPNVLNYTVNSGYRASGKQILEEVIDIGSRLTYEDILTPDQSIGMVIPIGKARRPYLPSQMIGEAHNLRRISINV